MGSVVCAHSVLLPSANLSVLDLVAHHSLNTRERSCMTVSSHTLHYPQSSVSVKVLMAWGEPFRGCLNLVTSFNQTWHVSRLIESARSAERKMEFDTIRSCSKQQHINPKYPSFCEQVVAWTNHKLCLRTPSSPPNLTPPVALRMLVMQCSLYP